MPTHHAEKIFLIASFTSWTSIRKKGPWSSMDPRIWRLQTHKKYHMIEMHNIYTPVWKWIIFQMSRYCCRGARGEPARLQQNSFLPLLAQSLKLSSWIKTSFLSPLIHPEKSIFQQTLFFSCYIPFKVKQHLYSTIYNQG